MLLLFLLWKTRYPLLLLEGLFTHLNFDFVRWDSTAITGCVYVLNLFVLILCSQILWCWLSKLHFSIIVGNDTTYFIKLLFFIFITVLTDCFFDLLINIIWTPWHLNVFLWINDFRENFVSFVWYVTFLLFVFGDSKCHSWGR